MKITLPYPPSANRYWRAFRGRTVLSAEAKKYKKEVAAILAAAGWTPATGAVAYTANIYRPQKSGDLDNRLKVLGDALTGFAWTDDKQVVELHAYRHDDKANPRVEMEIVALAEGPPRSAPPAEAVEGCLTAGCENEAPAGRAFCACHDTPNRLKKPPKVTSAYRAAKRLEEELPRRHVTTAQVKAALEEMRDECDCVRMKPFPTPLRGMRFVADENCKRCLGRATRRPSRGVEGELQPLPRRKS